MPPSGKKGRWNGMKEYALPSDECDHEGPVIIEPEEDDGEDAYRASCLICLAYGSPRDTHEGELVALLERVREQR